MAMHKETQSHTHKYAQIETQTYLDMQMPKHKQFSIWTQERRFKIA